MELKRKVHHVQFSENNNDKLVYLEFLRIFSIILVIFNHTGTHGFFLYAISEFSALYPFYFFCSVACKVAVPLFWMISGTLLIPKDESIYTLYKKRILRMVLALIVFSFIQYLFSESGGVRNIRILHFLKTLYTSYYAMAYWYIYAYIGVLLVLPFIRKMAKNMDRKEYKYLFGLFLIISGIIPMAEYLYMQWQIRMNVYVGLSMFSGYLIYFMAGHYLGNVIGTEEMSGKRAGLYMMLGFAAIVITCFTTKFMTDNTGQTEENLAQTFYNNLIFIPTYAIFYLTRYLSKKYEEHISERIKKVILTLGGAVFGVMLIENLWRENLESIFYLLEPYCKIFPSCIIWVLLTWICASGTTLLMKKIPLVRKLL